LKDVRGRVPVAIIRDGKQQLLVINVNELAGPSQDTHKAAMGIWFAMVPQGAYVMHVVPGSPAEKSGLKRGDVIAVLNGGRPQNWQQVTSAIDHAAPDSDLELRLWGRTDQGSIHVHLGRYREVFAPGDNWKTILSLHPEYAQSPSSDTAEQTAATEADA